MTKDKIIKKFARMPWEPWLHRRFDPLVTYLLMVGALRSVYKTQGIDGEFPTALYDTDDWYSTSEMFHLGAKEAEQYLQQKDIITLTRQCEDLLVNGRATIQRLLSAPRDPREDYRKVIEVIRPVNVYAWVAHGSEAYYHGIIREACRSYVPEEKLETFVGDISFPSKKNSLALMEDDMRAGVDVKTLHEKYSWIKARGGFRPGYTREEIRALQKETIRKSPEARRISDIPAPLQRLVREVQELVYLRTLRTDVLWELYHLAQPIFDRAATAFGVPSVKNCIPEDLLRGIVRPLPHAYAILKYYDEIIVTDSIIQQKITATEDIAHGVSAYKGYAQGVVKVVLTPQDINKLKTGDILITNMTVPAYLSAMRRAAAFVTDEGGITCHAAILSRELKKPCVIGTKIATKIFKDGDMVEVDANKGIVRKL